MTPEQRITELEKRINQLDRIDRFTIQKIIQILDGRNLQLGTGTGTKIGTATTQKLAFYNSTPISQRTNGSQAAVTGTADSTYSANEVTLINDTVTLVNELRSALVALGLIKGS